MVTEGSKAPDFAGTTADGTRVANYAQWRRAEDFHAMLRDPRAVEHMKPIQEIAPNDAHLYEVVESIAVDD